MTTIKVGSSEQRTVLDFDSARYSKNKIKQILRNLEFESCKVGFGVYNFAVINNYIKIGIFTISLILPLQEGRHRLKDFTTDMFIMICEEDDDKWIKLHSHYLFKNQYWHKYNVAGQFKVKHLVDAIYHCQRLNALKAFL